MRLAPYMLSAALFGFSCLTLPAALAYQAGNPQCANLPNLTVESISLDRTDYMAGGQPASVTDDVMMVEFLVKVSNIGGADVETSNLGYVAVVNTLAGKTVETLRGTVEVYSLQSGGGETTVVSLMVSELRALLQPSGEIAASISLQVEIDADERIRECVETDNKLAFTAEIRTEKVVQ